MIEFFDLLNRSGLMAQTDHTDSAVCNDQALARSQSRLTVPGEMSKPVVETGSDNGCASTQGSEKDTRYPRLMQVIYRG